MGRQKPITLDGEVYYPLPEAAKLAGVLPDTMYRWVRARRVGKSGIKFKALVDQGNGRVYISEQTIEGIKGRIKPINP